SHGSLLVVRRAGVTPSRGPWLRSPAERRFELPRFHGGISAPRGCLLFVFGAATPDQQQPLVTTQPVHPVPSSTWHPTWDCMPVWLWFAAPRRHGEPQPAAAPAWLETALADAAR